MAHTSWPCRLLLLLLILGATLQLAECLSVKFVPYTALHRGGIHSSSPTCIWSIQTGKDGKPASTADQDLEFTRSIIMAHQDKYSSDDSSSNSIVASSPNTRPTPSRHTSKPSRRISSSVILILLLGIMGAAVTVTFCKPQIMDLLYISFAF